MTKHRTSSRQQGIALIAVLWVVAALGLMVTGMMHVVKGEIRLANQLQRTTLDTGVADAAIRLTLQQSLQANQKEFRAIQTSFLNLFGRTIQVDIVPLNGLINLNAADTSLLAAAFQYAGRLPEGQAKAIAQAIDMERKKPNAKGEPARLHAVEDLLRLPEISYDTYAMVQDVFSTDLEDTQKVNPLAAPPSVLRILAQGQDNLAQQVLQARVLGGLTTDTSRLDGQHTQITATPIVHVRATVSSGDNTAIVRSWHLALSRDAHGLPWRVLGKQAPTQISRPTAP
jgi:general secretion pathway protein K